MKVAEQMALLDGPVYVERVALYDARQRIRAKKAIAKAIRLQVENKGFAFVEILAECPTHLRKTPLEAEAWVKDVMTRFFPLGVKKDIVPETWPEWKAQRPRPRQVPPVGPRPDPARLGRLNPICVQHAPCGACGSTVTPVHTPGSSRC